MNVSGKNVSGINVFGKTFRRLMLVLFSLALALGSTVWSSNPAKAAVPDAMLKFDFGPGAVESGYTQVLQSAAYSQSQGYGFADTSKVASRDRGTSDALRSDFLLPSGTPFLVDLANGVYDVKLISGDAIGPNITEVYAEGAKVARLKSSTGEYAEQTVTVTVQDGQLTLDFVSSVPHINALEIAKVYKFDFGPGAVQTGYAQVLQSTAYSSSQGYGFTDPSKVTSRDRGTSDALRSDFLLPSGTPFLVDLPNGDYRVTFISGDAIASSNTDAYAEGAKVATLRSGAGSYAEQTVSVTVNDGQLTLDFVSTVPRINALEISRIYKFDFGPGAVAAGYTGVLQSTAYSPGQGYGFEDTSLVASRDRGSSDPLESDFCLPGTPFLVDLPNGTYDVSILTGDELGKTLMDVRAEGLLELYSFGAPAAGKYNQASFPIKVEDGQLQLDFPTSSAHVNAIVISRRPDSIVDDRITVFLAGDSTVSDYDQYGYPQAGWGQMLPQFLDDQGVAVDNQAKRGRSSKSFYDEGSLDTIMSRIKPGDYLLIMFGINDAATTSDRHTDPETTFKEYLTKYIDAARAHEAIPILVTSQSKRTYDDNGVFYNSIGQYPEAMRELGADLSVPVIDLNAMSIDYYNSIGVEATKDVFLYLDPGEYPNFPNGAEDHVHFQENGATQLARLVSQAIKDQNIQPLAQYVK